MQVQNPSNGKIHEVTERAYDRLYKNLGFKIVGGDEDGSNVTVNNDGGDTEPAALTKKQYDEIMRNKENVLEALFYYGNDVEFSDRMTAGELRKLLNEVLAAKGLLPDGN